MKKLLFIGISCICLFTGCGKSTEPLTFKQMMDKGQYSTCVDEWGGTAFMSKLPTLCVDARPNDIFDEEGADSTKVLYYSSTGIKPKFTLYDVCGNKVDVTKEHIDQTETATFYTLTTNTEISYVVTEVDGVEFLSEVVDK